MSENRKTIIYLVTQPEHGGAATYVFDLATHLNPQEWEIYVAAGEDPDGWLFDEIKKYNSRLAPCALRVIPIYLKHLKRNLSLWHDLMSGIELFQLFKKIKPDVIHLNSSKVGATGAVMGKLYNWSVWFNCSIVQLLNKSKICNLKSKIIYTVHGLVLNEPTLKKWQYLYYKLSEKISGWFEDKLICVSEFDRQSVLKHKIARPEKLVAIHNGIDLNIPFLSKQEAQNKLNLPNFLPHFSGSEKMNSVDPGNKPFHIGFIGNLYLNKGMQYLVEAINSLITNYQLPVTLTLLSNGGPEKHNLKNQIKQLKLENHIRFHSGQNAKLLLKTFDLFILPSIKEGLSYTLIEALAAELPIIATRVGGNPEIIQHEYNGLLVEPANPQALSDAIYRIYSDQNLKNELISNSLKSVQKFSLENMLQQTVNIYNSEK